MRMPHVRFTVRRMMVAVAVVAVLMGILQAWEIHNRRWAELHSRMSDEYHLEANRLADDFFRKYPNHSDLDIQKWEESAKREWEHIWTVVYYRDPNSWSKQKLQRAVWHPWRYFAMDPTPPPNPELGRVAKGFSDDWRGRSGVRRRGNVERLSWRTELSGFGHESDPVPHPHVDDCRRPDGDSPRLDRGRHAVAT
jgi:hypothetical protein